MSVTVSRNAQGTLLPAPPTRGPVRSANIHHLLPHALGFVFHIALVCFESLYPGRHHELCLLPPHTHNHLREERSKLFIGGEGTIRCDHFRQAIPCLS